MTIYDVMRSCNRYFAICKNYGTFTIINNTINNMTGNYIVGAYIMISGSFLNDGVYKITDYANDIITVDEVLTDEAFCGDVVKLKVPKDFVELSTEIIAYVDANQGAIASTVKSESIPNYSYTLKDDVTYKAIFSDRLSTFRTLNNPDWLEGVPLC